MRRARSATMVAFVAAACALAGAASAQSQGDPTVPPAPAPRPAAPATAATAAPVEPAAASATIAVVAAPGARDAAFALARALYATRLRPPSLDEVRARVLAGDPPPPNATRALVDLAEVRSAARGDDAASRQLLVGLARQVGASALLVVQMEAPPAELDAGAAAGDAGAAADAAAGADGGTPPDAAAPATSGSPGKPRAVARLFLADAADFDAARYEADGDGPGAWKKTVASLQQRFPRAAAAAPKAATSAAPATLHGGEKESKPFYSSPWFWGAVGAAALVGGAFYFATRDNDSGTIHLQMQSPR